MKDSLAELYEQKILTEASNLKTGMTVPGKGPAAQGKSAELEGDTKKVGPKGSGPEAADVDKAEEAPKELNPGKDKISTKPSTQKKVTQEKTEMIKKSFMELYDQVMVKEADVEDPSLGYNDEQGDFPPAGAEGDVAPEDTSDGEDIVGESDPATILNDIKDKIDELIAALGGGTEEEIPGEEIPGEADASQVQPQVAPESVQHKGKPMGEAKNEPEPKEFNANITELQKRKLGGKGVKTNTGKASETGISSKDRSGKMDNAPKGTPIGGTMKVGGTGPAANAKNASALED